MPRCLLAGLVIVLTLAEGQVHAWQAIVRGRVVGKTQSAVSADPAERDAKALEAAKISADDAAALIGYLKMRTLSDTDMTRIQTVIRQMGDEDFEKRQQAEAEVEKFGPAAIAPLRSASQNDADPEVAYRAGETLSKMETVSHSDVALAVVRALRKLKPQEAPQALLGYLPLADTFAVEEEIRLTLQELASRDGKPEPVLVAALRDPSPVRRTAAALALLSSGNGKQPKAFAEVYAQIRDQLPSEKDAETRFQISFAMLINARDASAVPELIKLIPDVQRGRLWQIEDYLVQLAGKEVPKIRTGMGTAALTKARDAWAAWWQANQGKTDLAKFEYAPTTTGRLMLVSMDSRGWGNAKVAELGPDLRERWKIRKLNAPVDCRMLPNGRAMIMEQNNLRISEWDPLLPDALVVHTLQGPPVGFQPLASGNVLVAHRHMVAEYDKDWKQLKTFSRNQSDILAAHKLDNGQILVLCQNPGSVVRLDDQWKELPNPVRIGQPFWQPRMHVIDNDRVLITEQNRVVEYDLSSVDKREVWKFNCSNPSCVQRLSNGNTLIVESTNNTVREISPEGESLWSFTPSDGMRVMRAERR